MRIALVNSEYPAIEGRGGIATYTSAMANALAALGHTVYVCGRNVKHPRDLETTIRYLPFGGSRGSLIHRLYERLVVPGPLRWDKACARGLKEVLRRLHKKEGLDIVEVPDYGGLGLYLGGTELPAMVINFHTPSEMVAILNKTQPTKDDRVRYRFEENAIKNGSVFRCPSVFLKDLISIRYRIPASSIAVIRNPLSTSLFDAVKKNHPSSSDRFDLLFAGRLEYRKGIEVIAGNIKAILEIDPRITLTFAGETELAGAPNYRLQVEHCLSEVERGRIWFLGPVNRSQLSVLYCRSTMLLLPSLFENAPYVLLEAMASRLPVIGAATGGIPEIIRHGETGLLFPAEDIDALRGCIREFIKNPGLATACADKAYQDLTTLYHPKKIAVESIALYESVLRTGRR